MKEVVVVNVILLIPVGITYCKLNCKKTNLTGSREYLVIHKKLQNKFKQAHIVFMF